MRQTEIVKAKMSNAVTRMKQADAPAYLPIWQPFEEVDSDTRDDEPLLALRGARDRSEFEFRHIEVDGRTLWEASALCQKRISTASTLCAAFTAQQRHLDSTNRRLGQHDAALKMAKEFLLPSWTKEVTQEGMTAVTECIRGAEREMFRLCYFLANNMLPLNTEDAVEEPRVRKLVEDLVAQLMA